MKLLKLILTLLTLILFPLKAIMSSEGPIDHLRVVWSENPSTKATIGWNYENGKKEDNIVYFDTKDHGQDIDLYPYKVKSSINKRYKGMNNTFAKLSGLQPDTRYYFVIGNSNGLSKRFWFQTAPADSSKRISLIAGGDSRNNRDVRRNANIMVAKLNATAVLFNGDYTNIGTKKQWKNWFTDWQLTISNDGRVTPIIPGRGNHESSNKILERLFAIPKDNFFALDLGGSLIRSYTLNSESGVNGDQLSWLEEDLKTKGKNSIWRITNYHKPIRPHVKKKSEGSSQYKYWAPLFHEHNVQLSIESDSHTLKYTYPIRPTSEKGNDEGFVRDDRNGTVYIGEGCWGAPLRDNDDDKSWSFGSAKYNHFHWLFVDTEKIEIRTVLVDNANVVESLTPETPFIIPQKIKLWTPQGEEVLVIEKNPKKIEWKSPQSHQRIGVSENVKFTFNIKGGSKQTGLALFQNGQLIAKKEQAPFEFLVGFPAPGVFEMKAQVYEDGEFKKFSSIRNVWVGNHPQKSTLGIEKGSKDGEEKKSGKVHLDSDDLEMVDKSVFSKDRLIGLQFSGASIPGGAKIKNAYLQFTAENTQKGKSALYIYGELSPSPLPFKEEKNNLSSRVKTTQEVFWSPPPWARGEKGLHQKSPNIASIIQEIVNLPNWNKKNITLFIKGGEGKRTSYSFEGSPSLAPKLFIELE